jgi:hypothetical protein
MAKITYLGQLGSTGVSRGSHLHAYVKNLATGEYEDPGIHRSKFLNVRVGQNRVPKYIPNNTTGLMLNPAAGLTMTSPWGPRNTGIPGASTDHKGRDYAGAEGTPIFVEGDVKFTPRSNVGGYGNLATWTTPDQKYELGYGHMKTLGEASDLMGSSSAPALGIPYGESQERTKDILEAFMYGTQYDLNAKEQKSTGSDLLGDLKRQLVASLLKGKTGKSSSNFLSKYLDNSQLQEQYQQAIFG